VDSSSREIERLEAIIQRLRQHSTPAGQPPDSQREEGLESSDTLQQEIVHEDMPIIPPTIGRSTLLGAGSDTMPTENTTSLAVNAYLTHGDPIFHVIPKEDCLYLIDQVYHRSNTPSNSDICELFAIAAAGCHFNNIPNRDVIMSNFIEHSSARLLNGSKHQNLQRIRSYLSLSMCWDPARSPTARVLIGEFQLGYIVAFINL
jgi:hypothetical protein